MSIKSSSQECQACGDGILQATQRLRVVEHQKTKGKVEQVAHQCDSCGAVLFDENDVRNNRRAFLKFKKQVDGIPSGQEISAMRTKANLTQKVAAEIFGGGPVAFSKYENDDLIPDEAMVSLLRLAITYPDTVARLAKIKGISYEAPAQSFVFKMHHTVDLKIEQAEVRKIYESLAHLPLLLEGAKGRQEHQILRGINRDRLNYVDDDFDELSSFNATSHLSVKQDKSWLITKH